MQTFLNDIGINDNDIYINGKNIHLTKREFECIELMSKGYTVKGIGKILGIAPKTAVKHIDSLKVKIKDEIGYNYCKDSLVDLQHNLLKECITKI